MYFHQFRYGPLGREEYAGHEITGWKIAFRRWNHPQAPMRLQRLRFNTPSRFGALRTLIRDSRAWLGKVYFLEIESITPLCKAHYELMD